MFAQHSFPQALHELTKLMTSAHYAFIVIRDPMLLLPVVDNFFRIVLIFRADG